MYALQKKSLRIKNHDGTVAEVPALLTHDEERLEAVEAAVTAEAATRAAEDLSLSSGIATLSSGLTAAKKRLKIAERDIENLQDAARGTLYKDIEDSRTLHSKTLGDAEVCGSDTTVLPNGLLNSIGGRTVVWNQLFNKENYVTITHNGITYTRNENGYKVTGTASSNSYYGIFTMPADNHKYFISGCPNGGSTSTYMIRIADTIGGTTGYDIGSGVVINNTNGIEIFMRVLSGVTIDAQFMPLVTDLTQLTMPDLTSDAFEALIDTSVYHPYNAGTLMSLPCKSVVTQGRNILPRFVTGSNNGITMTQDTDGTITLSGTATAHTSFFPNEQIVTDKPIIASINNASSVGTAWNSSVNLFINGNSAVTATTQNAKRYSASGINGISLHIASGVVLNGFQIKPQIEYGSTATTYSPYCRTSLVVPQAVKALTGYGWSAGSVCNEVDWSAKTYIKRVDCIVLDGSEDRWIISTSGNGVRYFGWNTSGDNIFKGKYGSSIVSEFDNYYSRNNPYQYDNDKIWELILGVAPRVRDNRYSSIAEWKAHLAENPVRIYYELATPIVTDISSLIDDNLLTSLETGGTVTFVADGVDPSGTTVLTSDEQSLPVPNSITYQTKIAS